MQRDWAVRIIVIYLWKKELRCLEELKLYSDGELPNLARFQNAKVPRYAMAIIITTQYHNSRALREHNPCHGMLGLIPVVGPRFETPLKPP